MDKFRIASYATMIASVIIVLSVALMAEQPQVAMMAGALGLFYGVLVTIVMIYDYIKE